MIQQTEIIEDLVEEVEELCEHNLCLEDDVKQLQAELAESVAKLHQSEKGKEVVYEAMAEFLYIMERTHPGGVLGQLGHKVKSAGFRYEVVEGPPPPYSAVYPSVQGRYRFRLERVSYPPEQELRWDVFTRS